MAALRIERDTSLICYSSLTSDSSNNIKYLDFIPSETRWVHISCNYDWSNKILKGSLLVNNINYAYYDDLTKESSIF